MYYFIFIFTVNYAARTSASIDHLQSTTGYAGVPAYQQQQQGKKIDMLNYLFISISISSNYYFFLVF